MTRPVGSKNKPKLKLQPKISEEIVKKSVPKESNVVVRVTWDSSIPESERTTIVIPETDVKSGGDTKSPGGYIFQYMNGKCISVTKN